MSYIQFTIATFMNGSIVTPNIEGGEHVGVQDRYRFEAFDIHAGQGLKSQIDNQKHRLEGGPV
ncbi:MAG: hypothetical protein JKY03_02805 [Aureispira sp.]|nr:hypothetical protein [Aureispira sp.]